MKAIILSIAFSLTSWLVSAQETTKADVNNTTITVTVPVKSTEGHVVFGLYTESNFMRAPLMGLESDIKDGKATVTFTDVEPGVYAVILFHDKNDNKQMDFDLQGMPQEMYGVSNNVMSMGPPQWTDAKFEVAGEPVSLEIRM